MNRPADALLYEAIDYVLALGETVWITRDDGAWRYAEPEGEIVARAIALGMMGHAVRQ